LKPKIEDLNVAYLTWQNEMLSGQVTYAAAVEYCANLTFAGHDDWRVPNINV